MNYSHIWKYKNEDTTTMILYNKNNFEKKIKAGNIYKMLFFNE